MKKLLRIAALCLAIALMPFAAHAEEYEDSYVNTGCQRADIIGHAATQIGYTEGMWSINKYGAWMDANKQDWCAIFVSWCADRAGVAQSVIPHTTSATTCCYGVRRSGQWHYSQYRGGDYTPRPGDLIFFNWIGNYDNTCSHVGIVAEVTENTVITVEGNAYYSGEYKTLNWNDGVRNKCYSLDNRTICGYGVPAYEGEETAAENTAEALKRAETPPGGCSY